MIIGMDADEYRRLAHSFRGSEDLSLRELRLLKELAREADNSLLVKRVGAQIKRQIRRMEPR